MIMEIAQGAFKYSPDNLSRQELSEKLAKTFLSIIKEEETKAGEIKRGRKIMETKIKSKLTSNFNSEFNSKITPKTIILSALAILALFILVRQLIPQDDLTYSGTIGVGK